MCCENLKQFACVVFEKIKLKYLKKYTWKIAEIFTASSSQKDLSKSVKKTMGCKNY